MCKQPASALAACLFATFIILAPGLAWALGLGSIQSETHIGQNLEARIPILAAGSGDLQGLTVGLADPEAYRRAGIRENDFLFSLKFQVEQGANGPYVLITSARPVRLPFLNILVHAHWASGDVTRQYTVLLNPPVFASPQPEKTQSAAPVAVPSAPARQTPIERQTPPARPVPRPAVQSPASAQPAHARVYGPVRRGQTLWSIANGLRAGAGVNQMMIAIYHANPQAFYGNINRLRAGATLRVPSRGEVERISRVAAKAEVAKQMRNWETARSHEENRGVPAAAVPSKPAASPSAPQAGEVVLTAPKLTQSVAAGAGAATRPGAAAATAGGAAAAVAEARAGKGTKTKGATRAAVVPPASAGGPARLHNAELANLAAGGKTAVKPQTSAKTRARPASRAGQNTNGASRTSRPPAAAKTAASTGFSATVRDWLASPKGWIVIALIVLFLILLGLLFLRHRRRHEQSLMAMAADASDTPPERRAEPIVASSPAASPEEDETPVTAFADERLPDDAEAETTRDSGPASLEEDGVADALAQADLYADSGDYAGAAKVLSAALETAPGRRDLRLRLLEMQFAADDGPAFRAAAEELHWRVSATDPEWRSVAVMGRELLPDEPLFAEDGEAREQPSALAPIGGAGAERKTEPADLEFELNGSDEGESAASGSPDEFERGLGELSTLIETYMPENDEGAVALRLTPEGTESPGSAGGEAEAGERREDFVPEEYSLAADAAPFAAEESGTALDLAQAYLELGDRESARDILEEILDGDNEAQREKARELLESLN